MNKIVCLLAVTFTFIACASKAQDTTEGFDAQKFYTEYIEPLNNYVDNGCSTLKVGEYVLIEHVANLQRIKGLIIHQQEMLDGTRYDGLTGETRRVVFDMDIKTCEINLDQLFDMKETFDYHKEDLPEDYYNKITEEINVCVCQMSTQYVELKRIYKHGH